MGARAYQCAILRGRGTQMEQPAAKGRCIILPPSLPQKSGFFHRMKITSGKKPKMLRKEQITWTDTDGLMKTDAH